MILFLCFLCSLFGFLLFFGSFLGTKPPGETVHTVPVNWENQPEAFLAEVKCGEVFNSGEVLK